MVLGSCHFRPNFKEEDVDNLFTQFDSNVDGKLSYIEVHQTFAGLGMFADQLDFQSQWAAMDDDGCELIASGRRGSVGE